MYLDTLIIGHKLCNMLRILNELTLQKELQNFVTNLCFGDFFFYKIKHKNHCQSQESNPAPFAPQTYALPLYHWINRKYRVLSSYLTVSMHWVKTLINKNKFAGHTFSTNYFFSNILTCMYNYIWQTLIFTRVGFTASSLLKCKILIKRYRHSIF